jgi:hypothetical protein
MKTKTLITQIVVDQTPRPSRRASGDRTRAPRWPVMSPATTVDSTPENPSSSAAR